MKPLVELLAVEEAEPVDVREQRSRRDEHAVATAFEALTGEPMAP